MLFALIWSDNVLYRPYESKYKEKLRFCQGFLQFL